MHVILYRPRGRYGVDTATMASSMISFLPHLGETIKDVSPVTGREAWYKVIEIVHIKNNKHVRTEEVNKPDWIKEDHFS